jgi:hypothetical protein
MLRPSWQASSSWMRPCPHDIGFVSLKLQSRLCSPSRSISHGERTAAIVHSSNPNWPPQNSSSPPPTRGNTTARFSSRKRSLPGGRETRDRDAYANRARTPEPDSPAVPYRSAICADNAKFAVATNQSRHSRRRPEAPLRLHHRLQDLPSSPPPRATSPTNARRRRHSRANATTLCALREAAASGAASAAPPNGSSSAPQPAPLPPKPLTRKVPLRIQQFLRV